MTDKIVNLSAGSPVGDALPFVDKASTSDAATALAPSVIVVTLMVFVIPQQYSMYALGLLAFTLILGWLMLIVTPPYKPLAAYMNEYTGYLKSPKKRRNKPESVDETESTIERKWFETDGNTQEVIDVERVYQNRDAIMLTDDSVVAGIEIQPPSLVNAEAETLERVTNTFRSKLKQTIDFDFQIYLTTRGFDTQRHLKHYEFEDSRLDTNEEEFHIQGTQNSIWEHYIDDYEGFVSRNFENQEIRYYYVFIRVTPDEVEQEGTGETVESSLSKIPIFGRLFPNPESEAGRPLTDAEILNMQIKQLNSRIGTFSSVFTSMEGANAERISAAKHAALLYEFWEGESLINYEVEEFLNDALIIGGDNYE